MTDDRFASQPDPDAPHKDYWIAQARAELARVRGERERGERASQVFTTADPVNGVWDWGWQCFDCCEEEDGGYGTPTTAERPATTMRPSATDRPTPTQPSTRRIAWRAEE